jgi:hypothetical protein
VRVERFLIVSAGGDARVLVHLPTLRLDQFAYRLVIEVPAAWGSVIGTINVPVPELDPTVELDYVEPDEVEEE